MAAARTVSQWPPRRLQSESVTVQLSELEVRALDDQRANSLRFLLINAIGERVFAEPHCYPAREPGSWLRLQLHVVSGGRSVTFEPKGLTVAQGAPLSAETLSCIQSRISPEVRIDRPFPNDTSDGPLLQFEGESAIELLVGRPLI